MCVSHTFFVHSMLLFVLRLILFMERDVEVRVVAVHEQPRVLPPRQHDLGVSGRARSVGPLKQAQLLLQHFAYTEFAESHMMILGRAWYSLYTKQWFSCTPYEVHFKDVRRCVWIKIQTLLGVSRGFESACGLVELCMRLHEQSTT